jgi:hypothetical protein
MISGLVTYLDANDAGLGFYELVQQLGERPPRLPTATARWEFSVSQVKRCTITTPVRPNITILVLLKFARQGQARPRFGKS